MGGCIFLKDDWTVKACHFCGNSYVRGRWVFFARKQASKKSPRNSIADPHGATRFADIHLLLWRAHQGLGRSTWACLTTTNDLRLGRFSHFSPSVGFLCSTYAHLCVCVHKCTRALANCVIVGELKKGGGGGRTSSSPSLMQKNWPSSSTSLPSPLPPPRKIFLDPDFFAKQTSRRHFIFEEKRVKIFEKC